MDSFGSNKLVWASDFPFTRYEDKGLTTNG